MDEPLIRVVRATPAQYATVLALVQELFDETADGSGEFDGLDLEGTIPTLVAAGPRFAAFLALDDDAHPVGVATITEALAAYAGGWYGILSEMYVRPAYRGAGVGEQLLDEVKAYGRARGWRRIDVTAPPEAKWKRSVAFYERNGFVFTGPKLRFDL